VSHDDFDIDSLKYSVALLFLQSIEVVAEPHINTICLPPKGANFDHTRCYGTGWGKDVFGQEGRFQAILKKVDLPIVPFQQCSEDLKKVPRLRDTFRLHPSFICAGGEEEGKDLCTGDGGL